MKKRRIFCGRCGAWTPYYPLKPGADRRLCRFVVTVCRQPDCWPMIADAHQQAIELAEVRKWRGPL
jgi:hypothetical protein